MIYRLNPKPLKNNYLFRTVLNHEYLNLDTQLQNREGV